LTCEYIEFEALKYPSELNNEFPHMTEDDLKCDAKNISDNKVWNIAITIDKVMHVLRQMNIMEPPIRDLSFQERYKGLWEEEMCLRESLVNVLNLIENCEERDHSLHMINQSFVDMNPLNVEEDEKFFEERFIQIRYILA
jgi:hypothetical protein